MVPVGDDGPQMYNMQSHTFYLFTPNNSSLLLPLLTLIEQKKFREMKFNLLVAQFMRDGSISKHFPEIVILLKTRTSILSTQDQVLFQVI